MHDASRRKGASKFDPGTDINYLHELPKNSSTGIEASESRYFDASGNLVLEASFRIFRSISHVTTSMQKRKRLDFETLSEWNLRWIKKIFSSSIIAPVPPTRRLNGLVKLYSYEGHICRHRFPLLKQARRVTLILFFANIEVVCCADVSRNANFKFKRTVYAAEVSVCVSRLTKCYQVTRPIEL